jgi:hypothetical protein
MENPEIDRANHLLNIELSNELYTALLAKVKATGQTETELVIQGLRQILGDIDPQNHQQERFAALEIALEMALEKKLKQYVEGLIKDRVSSSESSAHLSTSDRHANIADSNAMAMPIPTIRPLQIGDRVLILEPDSAYYMAKLLVIRTSLIRATVATETGEMTFLKRDLRFVEAAQV